MITFEKKVLPQPNQVQFHTGDQEYRYPSGARVMVVGLDDPSKIGSTEFDIVYVNEATELDEDDWGMLLRGLRNGQLSYQQIIADCNPERSRTLVEAAVQCWCDTFAGVHPPGQPGALRSCTECVDGVRNGVPEDAGFSEGVHVPAAPTGIVGGSGGHVLHRLGIHNCMSVPHSRYQHIGRGGLRWITDSLRLSVACGLRESRDATDLRVPGSCVFRGWTPRPGPGAAHCGVQQRRGS